MQSVFIGMEEVREILNVSQAEAYRVIKRLNDELKKGGYLVISGRVIGDAGVLYCSENECRADFLGISYQQEKTSMPDRDLYVGFIPPQ